MIFGNQISPVESEETMAGASFGQGYMKIPERGQPLWGVLLHCLFKKNQKLSFATLVSYFLQLHYAMPFDWMDRWSKCCECIKLIDRTDYTDVLVISKVIAETIDRDL